MSKVSWRDRCCKSAAELPTAARTDHRCDVEPVSTETQPVSARLIPPLLFIPVAEALRLIDKIGAWVLREACRTAGTWPEHLTIAVNLSPAQFLAGAVSEGVAAALKETGLMARGLEPEITETLLLDNTEAIMAELHKLKAMGIAIVMDDFETGYSINPIMHQEASEEGVHLVLREGRRNV